MDGKWAQSLLIVAEGIFKSGKPDVTHLSAFPFREDRSLLRGGFRNTRCC